CRRYIKKRSKRRDSYTWVHRWNVGIGIHGYGTRRMDAAVGGLHTNGRVARFRAGSISFEHSRRLTDALALAGFALAAAWLPERLNLRSRLIRSSALVLVFGLGMWSGSLLRASWDVSEDRR